MRVTLLLAAVPPTLLLLACTPDRPTPKTALPAEGEPSEPAATTSDRVASEELPRPVADGGRPSTRQPAARADGGALSSPPPSGAADVVQDRLIAKLRVPASFDEAALRRAIEAETGAEVVAIRKGPLGLVSIQFASTDPPRGPAEQRTLLEKTKRIEAFKYVEPERRMYAK